MKGEAVSTLFDVTGKAALVTGASGGLGRAASQGPGRGRAGEKSF